MRFYNYFLSTLVATALATGFTSCSDEDDSPVPPLPPDPQQTYGMLVLNEGQWTQNNASLDVLNLINGSYTADAYTAANPDMVLELGDVANDIVVAGDQAYIVVNGSHKVEVVDAATLKHEAKIDVNSPRCAAVDGNYLYVTSYVGGDNNNGSVVKIDRNTNAVVGSVSVGIHPEGLAVVNNKLYVTSTQDYGTGEFDNRLFVVDINTFTVSSIIEVALNMTQIAADASGMVYVAAMGNYADVASGLYTVNTANGNEVKRLNVSPVTKFALYKDQAYVLGSAYDANWVATYTLTNLNTTTGVATQINLDSQMETPYALAVNPADGTLYVSDARDYMSSGRVYAVDVQGNITATYNAGVCPGHFAFYTTTK